MKKIEIIRSSTSASPMKIKKLKKIKKEQKNKEIPIVSSLSSDQVEIIQEFFFGGYDENIWKVTLSDLIDNTSRKFRILLEFNLSHAFKEISGQYHYPSDQFLCILRNKCSQIEEERRDGQQIFFCIKK